MLPKPGVCHSSPFLDNLHFDHFAKSVNLISRLKYLTKCSKWILSKKGMSDIRLPQTGVCHSSPVLENIHFEHFVNSVGINQVGIFDEMFEMEIV